jgi:hypothetical protein
MSQGAVKKRWGVKFYALAVSIGVHVIALSIFAAVKLSQAAPIPLKTTTVVTISQAAVLADRAVVAPKPKINPAGEVRRIVKSAGTGPVITTQPMFDLPKQDSQLQMTSTEHPRIYPKDSIAEDKTTTTNVEFFNSPAQGRRICFVVDCSGSMQGLWRQVKAELLESIRQLEPDQYFSVIVFGAGSIMESGGGWLVRATDKTKKDAENFVGAIEPRGFTNASAALEHAIKIKDKSGEAPSVIYFLTDGFELNEQDNFRFAHQVETMLKSFAPKTAINTIGFWPDDKDRILLDMIARQSGGRFMTVGKSSEQKDKEY